MDSGEFLVIFFGVRELRVLAITSNAPLMKGYCRFVFFKHNRCDERIKL